MHKVMYAAGGPNYKASANDQGSDQHDCAFVSVLEDYIGSRRAAAYFAYSVYVVYVCFYTMYAFTPRIHILC